jgi:hypothetical protein
MHLKHLGDVQSGIVEEMCWVMFTGRLLNARGAFSMCLLSYTSGVKVRSDVKHVPRRVNVFDIQTPWMSAWLSVHLSMNACDAFSMRFLS